MDLPLASHRRRPTQGPLLPWTVFALLLTVALIAGCARPRAAYSVSGTDEDRLDQHAVRMEEFRSRSSAGEIPCSERCFVSQEVCGISSDVCEISGRMPDRSDVAQRCTQSQEECARFNDECSQCRG